MVPLQVLFHRLLPGLTVVDCIVLDRYVGEAGTSYEAGDPFTMALRFHDTPDAAEIDARLGRWADASAIIGFGTMEMDGTTYLLMTGEADEDELVLEVDLGDIGNAGYPS